MWKEKSGSPLDLYLESILQKGINMQRNIPESKKLVKRCYSIQIDIEMVILCIVCYLVKLNLVWIL